MAYKKIHQIRIDFNVTEKIRRYVFVYIIEAEDCYMIDSGVCGCEKQIASYMESIGRKLSDIKKIFLTHAHPDHIGSAAWFREKVGCEIYAGREERRWIEDIDLQFSERPIPNFYILAGRSTKVDHVLHDGDEVLLEEGLSIHAYRTAGHSAGEMSYRLEDAFFIGDTVPVITDIPIIIDVPEMIASIKMLRCQKGIRSFYPAWDHAYSAEEMKEKLEQAEELIMNLGKAIAESDVGQDLRDLTMLVSEEMKLQMFSENPLFAKTVGAFRKEWK
jgi:glyoxylase-like metal-dependent hydrolase (beta-lactamase superfamily II)